MSKRINARIDDDLARRLAEAERSTGQDTSTIIKLALDAYLGPLAVAPKHRLASIVGCAEGDPDLSSNYKEVIARGFSSKT